MEQERNNIVLIGMPSAGKSTLGIVLAKILNYQFVDADLVIQNQCDKTLQKLIDACGPEGFIQVENEILRDIEAENSIIATGGSAVYSDEAMKHLAEIGRVVYLQISYEELVSRLARFAGARRGAEGRHRHEPARALRRAQAALRAVRRRSP